MSGTIMIVDDAQFMRARLAALLHKQGYHTVEAEDGEAAVQSYRSCQPDAVLMDITMPRKDGLAALAEICRFDPQAKVIMLTALSQQAMVLLAMKAGARDFLVKPYNPERLLRTLKRVLG
ncbi:MAG: response regulator [Anaerolineae bacterium]|nr:response regulator [Anaerolineae bacterium]